MSLNKLYFCFDGKIFNFQMNCPKYKVFHFIKAHGITLGTFSGVVAGIVLGILLRLREEPWTQKEVGN
jgi:hypothetical protein